MKEVIPGFGKSLVQFFLYRENLTLYFLPFGDETSLNSISLFDCNGKDSSEVVV